jgi:hypothetical protein
MWNGHRARVPVLWMPTTLVPQREDQVALVTAWLDTVVYELRRVGTQDPVLVCIVWTLTDQVHVHGLCSFHGDRAEYWEPGGNRDRCAIMRDATERFDAFWSVRVCTTHTTPTGISDMHHCWMVAACCLRFHYFHLHDMATLIEPALVQSHTRRIAEWGALLVTNLNVETLMQLGGMYQPPAPYEPARCDWEFNCTENAASNVATPLCMEHAKRLRVLPVVYTHQHWEQTKLHGMPFLRMGVPGAHATHAMAPNGRYVLHGVRSPLVLQDVGKYGSHAASDPVEDPHDALPLATGMQTDPGGMTERERLPPAAGTPLSIRRRSDSKAAAVLSVLVSEVRRSCPEADSPTVPEELLGSLLAFLQELLSLEIQRSTAALQGIVRRTNQIDKIHRQHMHVAWVFNRPRPLPVLRFALGGRNGSPVPAAQVYPGRSQHPRLDAIGARGGGLPRRYPVSDNAKTTTNRALAVRNMGMVRPQGNHGPRHRPVLRAVPTAVFLRPLLRDGEC